MYLTTFYIFDKTLTQHIKYGRVEYVKSVQLSRVDELITGLTVYIIHGLL